MILFRNVTQVSEKLEFHLANEIWLPGGLIVSNRKHSHHHQHRTQYNLNTLRSHQLQLKFSERMDRQFIILLVVGWLMVKCFQNLETTTTGTGTWTHSIGTLSLAVNM